jgi:hypothetical protein
MAFNLMTLMIKLGMDISGYSKGLDDAEAQANKMSKAVTNGLSTIGGSIVLGGIAAAGAAAVATGAFLASTIQPASDLNETISKVGIVFGSAAEQVLKMGETSANSMGMSKNAALAAAGTYGNLFRAMEIGENTSADMSVNLVKLAGDLASFNNQDPTEVLDKLRAGLSGETEPLRSLGVNLNQAQIEAKALEMGLWNGVGTISAAAKAQASYALILKQTTLAQGDFARTAGGLANQQRIMAANWDDLKAKIGTAFLPLINKVMEVLINLFNNPAVQAGIQNIISMISSISDTLVAVIDDIVAGDFGLAFDDLREGLGQIGVPQWVLDSLTFLYNGISGLITYLQNNQGVVVGIMAALTACIVSFAVTAGIALWSSGIAETFLVIAAVILLIIGVAYLLYTAWTENWGGIQEKMTAVWNVLQPIFQAVWDWLSTNIPLAIQAMVDFWNNTLFPALKTVWAWIDANLIPLFKAIGNLIGAVLKHDFEVLVAIWDQYLFPALKTMWEWFNDKIMPVLRTVGGWLKDQLGPAFDGIGVAIQGVIKWLQELTTKINNMSLPSWLQPGSPTPFETGLVGIRKQMSALARTELPRFAAELNLNGNPVNAVATSLPSTQATSEGSDYPVFPSANEIGYAIVSQLQSHGLVG